MATPRLPLLAALAAAFVMPADAADSPPPVSAKQAIIIAEESLANRGLNDKVFIQSVTLERTSVLKARSFWFVKWSESIPASDPKSREVGVKVTMDGNATRLVKEPGA